MPYRLQELIVDESPNLWWIQAQNNQLAWLDLSSVVKDPYAGPTEDVTLEVDDQHPSKVACNEGVATVDATGVVTALAEGEVTITAIGPETSNCNEAQKAEYTLTIKPEGAGIDNLTIKTKLVKAYDPQGREVKVVSKGVYVVNGQKVVTK